MFGEMARYVPSKIALWLIRAGVRMQYRHLARSPTARARRGDRRDGARRRRSALRLSADLPPARLLSRAPRHHAGARALAAARLHARSPPAAPRRRNGHFIIGRNFDFEGPEIFDREKAILFFKPRGKIPFASVAWLGMSGVITGLNAEGIFVRINAARSDDKGGEGMPVEILVREIMEQAQARSTTSSRMVQEDAGDGARLLPRRRRQDRRVGGHRAHAAPHRGAPRQSRRRHHAARQPRAGASVRRRRGERSAEALPDLGRALQARSRSWSSTGAGRSIRGRRSRSCATRRASAASRSASATATRSTPSSPRTRWSSTPRR